MKKHRKAFRCFIAATALFAAGFNLSRAEEPTAKTTPTSSYAESVQPIFLAHCAECHSPEKPKENLILVTAEGVARGGKHGAVVVPGDPAQSLLWKKVSAREMPPENPLSDADQETIRRWIAAGAPGLPEKPSSPPASPTKPTDDHWAFHPPVRPNPPSVKDASKVKTDIDKFIEAALEAKGLSIGAEADRVTLVRRVSLDLTGLPPSPDEIALYLADTEPGAYERMIERYLASPHYGECWGRHWLDVAGYADSNGYFDADSDRPLAYRYRDYVIRAFNADKPYDRFITEQIAGDELTGFTPGSDVTPDMAELLAATHFLRNAPDGTTESDGNDLERQTDRLSVIEGTVEIVSSSLMGLTMQCARCHDHKFDPIKQVEYYQMQAIFAGAYEADPKRWLKPNERVVTVGTRAEREANAAAVKKLDEEIAPLRKSLENFGEPLRDRLIQTRIEATAEPLRAQLKSAHVIKEKDRSEEQKALLAGHAEIFKVSPDDLAKEFPEYAQVRTTVEAKIASLEKTRPVSLAQISGLFESNADPVPHHLLTRGSHSAPGDVVEPDVPAALCSIGNAYQIPPRSEGKVTSGRRTALAKWLTSPQHPLVARVMVNRIWQNHFGRGIVATPGNFGRSGAAPTHPELLDFLATEFIRQGRSMKAMHRLILNSAVYKQASADNPAALAVDGENLLYWRYPLRRLDAEAVRDATLVATGELDSKMFGPYVAVKRVEGGQVIVDEKDGGAFRRSVYLRQRRTELPTVLELFDCPSMVTNAMSRFVSTIPLQSLALLNSDFSIARARAFAARLEREAGASAEGRISRAFLLAAGRPPSAAERATSEKFLKSHIANYENQKDSEQRVWQDFCQMLLASNAFLYVE